ncbi:hypothetical protein BDV25DRAFT_143534 [Aspergillus avenaceus]|uniref:Uncharacterized protein n=1 Tax=Aspergillus avenaceus TaxID=36643 RepID=A0A5N6TJU1_ASPAV|nr:hypothetical protein BDV25DRAFT_143534 [Aspergillus avenaceus]
MATSDSFDALRTLLEAALKTPKEQVLSGHIPLPPKLLLTSTGEVHSQTSTNVLEMTSTIFVGLAYDLLQNQTYNKIQSSEHAIRALNDVSQNASDQLSKLKQMLNVKLNPRIVINRNIPREHLHREFLRVLFEDVVVSGGVAHELDRQLTDFVDALSSLPIESNGEEVAFTFFVSEVNRKTIPGQSYTHPVEVSSIKLHLLRMRTDVYRELIKKQPEAPPHSYKTHKAARHTSHTTAHTRHGEWPLNWSNLWGRNTETQEDEEPEEPDVVALKAQYFIITAEVDTAEFQARREQLEHFFRTATGMGMKEYADRTTKVLFV